MRDLYHVSLRTGDVAMVPATHVQAESRRVLSGWLTALLSGRTVSIPGPVGDRWQARLRHGGGRCLDLMLEVDDYPAIRMAVAGHSRCGASLWASLHEGEGAGELVTSPHTQPGTPWLATLLLPGTLLAPPDDMPILADLQECVAWMWLLRQNQERH